AHARSHDSGLRTRHGDGAHSSARVAVSPAASPARSGGVRGRPCRLLRRHHRHLMRIQLNGEPRDLDAPLTIAALLEQLNINPRLVAVELNQLVIRRANYGETLIEDGAEVEIVAFVGGGSR